MKFDLLCERVWLSGCGLLGTFCHRNLPVYRRTYTRYLDSHQFNLPYCDRWDALPN